MTERAKPIEMNSFNFVPDDEFVTAARRLGYAYNPVTNRLIQNNSTNRKSILRQIEKARRKRLVLISCSGQKSTSLDLQSNRDGLLDGEYDPMGRPNYYARDLYCSPTFQKSVDWAERRGLPWAILSAKHGLIEPWEEIEDYDQKLTPKTRIDSIRWIDKVERQMGERFHQPAVDNSGFVHGWEKDYPEEIIILAGNQYAEPIEKRIAIWNENVENPEFCLTEDCGRCFGCLNPDWDGTWRTDRETAALYGEDHSQIPEPDQPEKKVKVTQPLKGLQIGERLKRLNQDKALFELVPSQPLGWREAEEALKEGATVWFKDWTDNPQDYGGPDYPVEDPDDLVDFMFGGYDLRQAPLVLSEPQQDPEQRGSIKRGEN